MAYIHSWCYYRMVRSVHQLVTFSQLWCLTEAVQTSHWRTMASFAMPFLHLYACAQKK